MLKIRSLYELATEYDEVMTVFLEVLLVYVRVNDLQSDESGSRLNDFDCILIINECVLPVYQFSSVVQLSYF